MGRRKKYVPAAGTGEWVRHNGKLCPPFPPSLEVAPPEPRPEADPLWPAFVAFVAAGGVVRRDLLTATDGRPEDWRFVWDVFRAGGEPQLSRAGQLNPGGRE